MGARDFSEIFKTSKKGTNESHSHSDGDHSAHEPPKLRLSSETQSKEETDLIKTEQEKTKFLPNNRDKGSSKYGGDLTLIDCNNEVELEEWNSYGLDMKLRALRILGEGLIFNDSVIRRLVIALCHEPENNIESPSEQFNNAKYVIHFGLIEYMKLKNML